MIGFYDYTVILTYASLVSAVSGMALACQKHPILAVLCLLFCGLCDMFDGKVARSKKNRTDEEKAFGIQIDSLSDIVAFGILPAVIAINLCSGAWYVCAAAALYALAGLIRLAYFNVTEELRQKSSDDCRKTYAGLPITSASLIFPAFFCSIAIYCMSTGDIGLLSRLFHGGVFRLLLTGLLGVTGLLFILPIRVRKPSGRDLWILLAIGACLALVLLAVFFFRYK